MHSPTTLAPRCTTRHSPPTPARRAFPAAPAPRLRSTGDWAFCPSHEHRDTEVIVFWSDRAYAARHVKADWEQYVPRNIGFDDFVGRYLKVMHEDKLLVGPNWDAHLCGIEMSALELAQRLIADERKG